MNDQSMTDHKSIDFWCNALIAAAGLTILMGLSFMLPPFLGMSYFNFLFFGHTGFPEGMGEAGLAYTIFLYGLVGAIVIGWMAPMIYLAHGPIRRGDKTAFNVFCLTIAIWFVIDSLVSIATGFWQNAASNVSLVVLFIVPLLMIRRRLNPSSK